MTRPKSKTKQILLWLPEDWLPELASLAASRFQTRSGLIRLYLRTQMNEELSFRSIFSSSTWSASVELIAVTASDLETDLTIIISHGLRCVVVVGDGFYGVLRSAWNVQQDLRVPHSSVISDRAESTRVLIETSKLPGYQVLESNLQVISIAPVWFYFLISS